MLGMVGSGGSIVTMPILVYVFGLNPVAATTYSLFIVGTAALTGSIQNVVKRNVHFPSVLVFGLTSIATVLLVRRFVLHRLPERILIGDRIDFSRDSALMIGFAALMLAAAWSMFKHSREAEDHHTEPNRALLFASGFGVGIATGLVGAGGGFLIVPALVLYGGLPIRKAIGTSLTIVAINSFSGVLSDLSYLRNIDWFFLLVFAALAAVGIFIGARISRFLPARSLRRLFGAFVVLMAVYILLREFYFQ